MFCRVGRYAALGDSNDGQGEGDMELTLCAIIYGPKSISEDVGDWLAEYGLFLQDPMHCDRNVLYENPHLLHEDDDEPVMTFSLKLHTSVVHTETLKVAPNLFEILNQEHQLAETEQPAAVSTPLHRSASNYPSQNLAKE